MLPRPYVCARRNAATKESHDPRSRRRRFECGALALEIANSRGLCNLASSTPHVTVPPPDSNRSSSLDDKAGQTGQSDANDANSPEEKIDGEDGTGGEDGRGSVAATAAVLISKGGKAGEEGAHLAQRANNAILEGVAWSLAGRGTTDGVRDRRQKQMNSLIVVSAACTSKAANASKVQPAFLSLFSVALPTVFVRIRL